MCVDVLDRDGLSGGDKAPKACLRVAVAGLGLIGEGAALRLLDEAGAYELCAALVRDASKRRSSLPTGLIISESVDAVLGADPDVVIDALPEGEAGRVLIGRALSRGVSIVSANKQAVAGSLAAFSDLARDNAAVLGYSASVGGGAPMVETVREARDSGEIVEIEAILNGTVNYVLSALAKGETFEAAVKQAQDAGFAEPDPTADLSGDDARAKIAILSYDAFGAEIALDKITTEALTPDLAQKIVEQGGVWKQISRISKSPDGAVSAKLSFERIGENDFFAEVLDEGNALIAKTRAGARFTCAGKGAGRIPTVASLFADLRHIKEALPPRSK